MIRIIIVFVKLTNDEIKKITINEMVSREKMQRCSRHTVTFFISFKVPLTNSEGFFFCMQQIWHINIIFKKKFLIFQI